MASRSRSTTPRNTPKRPEKKKEVITEADVYDPNSALFETLMNDPVKRALILKLITSEKASIQAYMQKEKSKAADQSPIGKVKQKCVLESPTALMRRRALEKLEKAKLDGPNSSNNLHVKNLNLPKLPYEELLKGVRAYVEVISRNEDRSGGVKALLRSMGASIQEEFNREVTHVIFKDGSFSTYERARLLKKHVVSVLWLDAVRNTRTRVPEKNYPAIGAATYNHNVSAICEKYENNYEEIINLEKKKISLINNESEDSQDSSDIIPGSQSDDGTVLSMVISKKPRRTINKKCCDIIDSDGDSNCGIIDGVPYKNRSKSLSSKTPGTPMENGIVPETPEPRRRTKKANDMKETIEVQKETLPTVLPEKKSSDTQSKNKRRTLYKDTTSEIFQELKAKSKRKSLYVSSLNKSVARTTQKTLSAVRSNLTNEFKEVEDSTKNSFIDNNLSSELKGIAQNNIEIESNNVASIKPRESLESVSTNGSEEFGVFITKRKKRRKTENNSFIKSNEVQDKSLIEDYLQLSSDNSTNVLIESRKSSMSTQEIIPSLQISQNIRSSDNNSMSQNLSPLRLSINSTNQLDHGNDANVEYKKDSEFVKYSSDSIERDNFIENSPETKIDDTNCTGLEIQKEKNDLNEDNSPIEESGTIDQNKSIQINCPEPIISTSNENTDIPPSVNEIPNKTRTEKAPGIRRKTSKYTIDQNKSIQNIPARSTPRNNTEIIPPTVDINEIQDSVTNKEVENLKSPGRRILGRRTRSTTHQNKSVPNIPAITTPKNINEIKIHDIIDPTNNVAETPGKRILRRRTSRSGVNPQSDNKIIANRKSMHLKSKVNKEDSLTDSAEMKNILERTNENTNKDNVEAADEKVIGNNIQQERLNETEGVEKKATSPITGEESSDGGLASGPNRRRRKLYRMNQTIDEEVRKRVEEENQKLKQQKLEMFKESSQPLPSYVLTNNAKQFIHKRLNELQSSGDEDQLPIQSVKRIRKNTPPRKINESADEQVSLLNGILTRNEEKDEVGVHTNVSCNLPIKPMLTRRSTMDFMPKVIKTPRKLMSQSKKKTSIVCTRFHRIETIFFQKVVTKLGCFDLERDVSDKTSHLIVGECKRTINILRAMARGIWILKADWLHDSMANSKWLPEEDYELTEFSAAVQQCRIEREAFGSSYSMDIFQNCGSIYITKGTTPKFAVLEELIVLCKGKVVTSAKNAKIIIGMQSNENAVGVKETWVLDSITLNKCKDIKEYVIHCQKGRQSYSV